jgi:hypothetical protein
MEGLAIGNKIVGDLVPAIFIEGTLLGTLLLTTIVGVRVPDTVGVAVEPTRAVVGGRVGIRVGLRLVVMVGKVEDEIIVGRRVGVIILEGGLVLVRDRVGTRVDTEPTEG